MAITVHAHSKIPVTHEEYGQPMSRSHEGLVVELGSDYMGDGDSSYFALVYDPASDDFTTVGYCSTYCPGCDHGRGRETTGRCRAVIDAPAEIIAKLAERRRVRLEAQQAERARTDAERVWHTPSKGAVIRVVAGRKFPQGLEGIVTWSGDSQFGPRVRVKFADGNEDFISAYNVEVIDWPGKTHHCTL